MINYDINELHLESDGGFILGQSILGVDSITSAANSWQDVKGDFTSIDLSRSVAQEKGVFFRPEVASLTLRTTSMDYLEGARGRNIRLRYKDKVLFVGTVTGARLSVDKFNKKNVVVLSAVDATADTNNFQALNFSAPEETTGQRIKRAFPDALVSDCERLIAAKELGNYKLADLLQEAADTQIGRYYVDRWNRVVVKGSPAPEPSVVFSDNKPGDEAPAVLATAENMIDNPGAEAGTNGWSSARGTLTQVATSWGAGAFHFRHTANGTGLTYVSSNETAVNPGALLRSTVAVRKGAGAGDVYAGLAVQYRDPEGDIVQTARGPITRAVATASTALTLDTEVPEGTDNVRVILYQYSTLSSGGAVDGQALDFDNVTLTELFNVEYLDYTDLNLEEDIKHTITGAVAEVSAQDQPTLFAYNAHPNAVLNNEEKYEPAVPYRQDQVDAWAASFPVRPSTETAPTSLSAGWQDGMAQVELLNRVQVVWQGKEFDSGVVGIHHSIQTDRWEVDLDLIPGHLVQSAAIFAPSPVRNFRSGTITDNSIHLFWNRPLSAASLTGFEIRYRVGKVAPGPDSGTVLANVDFASTSRIVTGLESDTEYSFSIWATTGTNVRSDSASITRKTTERIPSAPQSLTYTKSSPNTMNFSWAAPAVVGDLDDYLVSFTGGTQHVAGTSFVFEGDYNKDYQLKVQGRTAKGALGPATPLVSFNTDEVRASAPQNFTGNVVAYNRIDVSWTAPATPGDYTSYILRRKTGGYPEDGNDGTFVGQYGPGSNTAQNTGLSGSTTYYFAVWARTAGGLYSPVSRTAATTPQGIFNKVWEGQAVWSQTYAGDGSQRGGTDKCYYGYSSSFWGLMGSMAGFNVPAEVTNCYSVDKVELYFYNEHTYFNSGATCYLGTHNNSSKPGTFSNVAQSLGTANVPKGGNVGIDITGWARNRFKAGAKGITFGRPPSTSNQYYGYATGAGTSRPRLKIYYRTEGS